MTPGNDSSKSYYEKMSATPNLSADDERAILKMLDRCPGCGEPLSDGCLPGCSDRD